MKLSGSVGILYDENEHFLRSDVFCAPIATAIEAALQGHGLTPVLLDPPSATAWADPASPSTAEAAGGAPSPLKGILYLAAKNLELARALRQRVPLVLVLPDCEPEPPSLVVDDEQIGILAARTLLRAGRRRLIVVGGVEENGFMQLPYQRRVDGFIATATAAGAAAELVTSTFTHVAGSTGGTASRPVGEIAALKILEREERPDGVFAVNDWIAAEIAEWFAESGIEVPARIAVIGADNLPLRSATALSTIHVPKAVIATRAVETLCALLEKSSGPVEAIKLEPKFLARETTPAGVHP